MTLWSPTLPASSDPLYLRIAAALERDVAAGVLVEGSRLPTHRELARKLAITPVTVTRAYAAAARRGLVESMTGRGTFVRGVKRESVTGGEIDLSTNTIAATMPSPSNAILQRAAAALTTNYGIGAGSERHRAAGATWIGGGVDASQVVVTAGTQHALFCAFAAVARPGDTVLAESLTYHGAKAIAALLNIRFAPLKLDRWGIVPDAFERACRARTAKVLYTIPSLQNPTGSVMPARRRRELARIADKHGITIIEDGVCGFLVDEPQLRTFLPDRVLFVSGLGKALSAAMRVGFVAAPHALLARVQNAVAATALFASPVVAEIAASWIEDGTASRIVQRKRDELALRNRVARRILGKQAADPRSSHLWLELPRKWTGDSFAEEARRRGVRVASASSFAIDDVPRAIRVSIGAPATITELETALRILASIDEEVKETII